MKTLKFAAIVVSLMVPVIALATVTAYAPYAIVAEASVCCTSGFTDCLCTANCECMCQACNC